VRSCKQDEISDLLVTLAKEGKRVLRLKGGDPFVFGRGGEEAQALARAGVPFALCRGSRRHRRAGLCRIPVTHRDTNHAVTFITGHGADGKLTHLDWAAVSRGAPTLVFYMRANSPARLPRRCWRRGAEPMSLPPSSPMRASDQQVILTTLSGLAAAAETAPALCIMVIGRECDAGKAAQLASEDVR